MVKKLHKLVEFGMTKDKAKSNLERMLPYEPGHEAYSELKIGVKPYANGGYRADAQYQLKKGYKNVVQKPATGAYQSPLEKAIEAREEIL